jgi:hypothetical protein
MKRILLIHGAELLVFAFLATVPLLVVNPCSSASMSPWATWAR